MKRFLLLIFGLAGLFLVINLLPPHEKKVEVKLATTYSTGDPEFIHTMSSLFGAPLVDGNRVTALMNGDEIFPAMLEAIRGAESSVTFENYIFWAGAIGRQFTDALSAKAREGVPVHVLIDWVGSTEIDPQFIEDMRQAGVEIELYHPLRWFILSRLSYRTHRKILVVDGKIGFAGGVGIADKWMGNAQSPDHWRESMYRLEGPAVAHLQAAFMDNWMRTRGVVLHGPRYFPALEKQGGAVAQVIRSSPREASENVRLAFLLSIAAARRTIYIANAYFVPDDFSVETLVEASRHGVKVEIVLPGPIIDYQFTRLASRARWRKLLEAGVRIFEYQPTMYHCKVLIIDETWMIVGSTNWDNRSFRFNDEVNLNILDPEFAQKQVQVFMKDRAKSREVTLAEWKKRPWKDKIKEHVVGLMRQQL